LRKLANRQTNRQSNNDNYISSLAEIMNNSLQLKCFRVT